MPQETEQEMRTEGDASKISRVREKMLEKASQVQLHAHHS